MPRLILAACVLAFIGSVSAQNDRGSLAGIISDPSGAPLDAAPIQLKNKTTGAVARTAPHTEKLRVTERYRRVDFGHMEALVTFEDPATFVKPLQVNLKFDLVPQEELLEYVCENNHPEHQVGK